MLRGSSTVTSAPERSLVWFTTCSQWLLSTTTTTRWSAPRGSVLSTPTSTT